MPIKVAHMLNSMEMGGVENFLMNIYRNINRDEFQFDFILQSEEKSYFEDEITKLGGKIYKIPRFNEEPIKHIMELEKIFKENNYRVFHRHASNSTAFIDLLIARNYHVPLRVAHSHIVSNDKKILNKLFQKFLYDNSNIHLASNINAGNWLFGENRKFKILHNGIECEKYTFDEKIRDEYRKELDLDKEIAICHVGRFTEEKNHEFLIESFCELCKVTNNYRLFLCGDGELKEDMEKLCEDHNISDKVKFLGIRNDINKILQAMDIFALPSSYECLGIALIEAQMTNLPAVISEAVPKEVIYNGNVKRLKTDDENIPAWWGEIKKIDVTAYDRKIKNEKMIWDYDIKKVIEKLVECYK